MTDSGGVSTQRCDLNLDPYLTHPTTTCEKGIAKNRMHNFVRAGLAACLRAAGAEVDVERCIPDLSRVGENGQIVDAIMDVVAVFPNATRQYWFDVTVKSPHAARYNQVAAGAASIPGHAAGEGCKDKWNKYGRDVIPIAVEPYGRISDHSVRCLEEVAINAATLSDERWTSPNLLSSWLRRCQRLVVWAAADLDLAALGKGATKMEASIARGAMMRAIQKDTRRSDERSEGRTACSTRGDG